ncbi:MAG: TorD/DmsD family molecular chaperone [Bacteroidales bacterium]
MRDINKEQNLLKGYIMMLYFGGTMIMFDPSLECIYDFWTKGIIKQLPVFSSNPDFMKAAGLLRESAGKAANKYKPLREDYLTLFTDTRQPLAPPFESVYRSEKNLVSDTITSDVSNFYFRNRWDSKFRNKIPDDHLGIELLFLTYLIENYLDSAEKTNYKNLANEISSFINEHLISWIPRWSRDVEKHAKTLGYKGIALLVLSSVQDIVNIITRNSPAI